MKISASRRSAASPRGVALDLKEPDMPTAIVIPSRAVNAQGRSHGLLDVIKDPNLLIVIAFAAIGLLASLCLTLLLPLSGEIAAMLAELS